MTELALALVFGGLPIHHLAGADVDTEGNAPVLFTLTGTAGPGSGGLSSGKQRANIAPLHPRCRPLTVYNHRVPKRNPFADFRHVKFNHKAVPCRGRGLSKLLRCHNARKSRGYHTGGLTCSRAT